MTLHELEEWNIAQWSARNFTNATGISDEAIWLGLVSITAGYLFWIFLATRFRSTLWISIVALPPVALVAVGNSVQHLTWTLLFAEYAPGVATSVLLVIPASALVLWRMLEANRWLALPIAGSAVLWVVAAVQIVMAGRTLQPFQLVLQRFFSGLASSLGLPG